MTKCPKDLTVIPFNIGMEHEILLLSVNYCYYKPFLWKEKKKKTKKKKRSIKVKTKLKPSPVTLISFLLLTFLINIGYLFLHKIYWLFPLLLSLSNMYNIYI